MCKLTSRFCLYRTLAVGLCLLSAACASTAGTGTESGKKAGKSDAGGAKVVYETGASAQPGKAAVPTESPMTARISLSRDAGKLGDAVRAVGEAAGGNLVLMSGLETRPIEAFKVRRERLPKVAAEIAALSGLAVQECPDYYFLFAPGYEPLVDVSLAGRIDPKLAGPPTDVVFGSGIKLFTCFAWMSYALKRTIVADDSIAEARCGELALKQVPLEAALEAILKSARVVSLEVECTDEYIFIRNPQNKNPESALLNTEPLDPEQSQLLDRRVSVVLPDAPTPDKPLEMELTAMPLHSVLEALSKQLGVLVVTEKGVVEELPVNPVVMTNVRARTALDLLVRQWLVPEFGYQVTRDRIVIRRRQPASG